MKEDAKFEDGREAPLNLGAEDEADLNIISSLVQDAVLPVTEMKWEPKRHRFALFLNRFRWEDEGRGRHGAERVQSLMVIDNVLGVSSQGIDRADKDVILSVLNVTFTAGEDGAGQIILNLAGDGALRLNVEALEITLKDVTRPYLAPTRKTPEHPA